MTDRYVLFGNPVSQSKSPMIHAEFARQFDQDMTYDVQLAPVDGFEAALREFISNGGKGCNITTPFKLEAFDLATEKRPRAQIAGAVNTLKFEDGKIIADNFDGLGLVNDVQRNHGFSIAGKRVLIVGAGGAARGCALPFLEEKPASLTIANRTLGNADAIRDRLAEYGTIETCGLDDLGEGYDIVLNATSTSLTGECPAIPTVVFDDCALAYEMTYGKGLTPFLKLAQSSGVANLTDGVGMLVEQAAEGFQLWRGVRPDTSGMIKKMIVPLV